MDNQMKREMVALGAVSGTLRQWPHEHETDWSDHKDELRANWFYEKNIRVVKEALRMTYLHERLACILAGLFYDNPTLVTCILEDLKEPKLLKGVKKINAEYVEDRKRRKERLNFSQIMKG